MIRSHWRQLPLGLLVFCLVGCGGLPHSPDDMARARTALESSLETWKKGEKLDRLRTQPEPIEFTDDYHRMGYKLLDFRIEGTGYTDREFIRYTAHMTMQDRRGKKHEMPLTYLIVPQKSPIAISRDPYF